jgi:anaerobic magnesium-protoporphyrin IX monomethyl ester cyclase
MSRVLFTHSYFYKLDSKQWKFKQPYPPLGSLQAAAVVQAAGFDVTFFDVAMRETPLEIECELKKCNPDYFVIYEDGFNYLTKMCLTVMREASFTMSQLAKRYGCTVIVCGSDSSDQYEKYLGNGVDYVVRGEGEETLKELLGCLDRQGAPHDIPGLAFRTGSETITTIPKSVMRNLDALPIPAWNLIDLEPYRSIWKINHGYFSMNIATTRGCPYKCNWCAKPIYGNRYNSRSPEHVVNEIEFLLEKFRPEHFWMCDDIFGLKPGWVKRFSELIEKRGLKFKYKIQSRVDLLLEEKTIESLASSGADTVWVGAESGSQQILDAMDKGTTVKQIKEATKLLHQHHIKVAFFLQFGYSGEVKQDIDATLKMVLELMPDEIGISVSYPLPGTKFYDNVKNQLKEKQNWTDSDDLAMMYRATFSPAYYKVLHRYVHSRYRIKRGWEQLKKRNFKIRALASMIYHTPLSVVQGWRLNQLQHATR